MSKSTKCLFAVAIVMQVAHFVLLNNCKWNKAYYITDTHMFLMYLCSFNSIIYTICGMASFNQDKQFKVLNEQLQA